MDEGSYRLMGNYLHKCGVLEPSGAASLKKLRFRSIIIDAAESMSGLKQEAEES